MDKTPRTDAFFKRLVGPLNYGVKDFARTLELELAAVIADARRYRWLRAAPLGWDVMFEDENEDGPTGVAYRLIAEMLDAAIDAAIATSEGEKT